MSSEFLHTKKWKWIWNEFVDCLDSVSLWYMQLSPEDQNSIFILQGVSLLCLNFFTLTNDEVFFLVLEIIDRR